MEKLKAKLKKQGGFTMVELLIVVAIIAILVAVSIPMMNNALEKSRHAVDQANIRDAIALASIEYVTEANNFPANGREYFYAVNDNTHEGYLATTGSLECKCTCTNPAHATNNLSVKIVPPATTGIGAKPTITVSWKTDTSTGATIECDDTAVVAGP